MSETSPFLFDLPADHYGVHVANDLDARQLRYLVDQVGAEKITGSASRYSKRYPGSRIFVSTLLKRYRVKIPKAVYGPVHIPIYKVYLLLHTPSAAFKVGCSGDWISRALSFNCEFDPDRSVAMAFPNKAAALGAERMALNLFSVAKSEPPHEVPYGAYGHGEWLRAEVFDAVAAALGAFDTQHERKPQTLRQARLLDLRVVRT
ncbi:Orf17 [Pseudomonas syringae]|uniref:hypothetical protein n=1 Tax=Pseudomonas syringae TaxID=317 RepID=UPI001CA85F77|nr:hypothetical protein [Pseudomonas syringae]MCI3943180.1 Orf17 [Pseudomonas syringae]